MVKNVLMGIGNEMKGDDGIGNFIARKFSAPRWESIPCETVPENFTSVIKKEKPELLVIVDATEMGLDPGEIKRIPKEKLNSEMVGTHGMPLKHMVSYLEESAGKVIFIGIQPGDMVIGNEMSDAVAKAGKIVMKILQNGKIREIESL